jgi:uncharacterized membrane protein YuzA (DUF378 family)
MEIIYFIFGILAVINFYSFIEDCKIRKEMKEVLKDLKEKFEL